MDEIVKTIFDFIAGAGRYVLPLVALFVLFVCTISLLRSIKKRRVMAFLVNSATADKMPIDHWEISIGRSKTCDIVLGYNTISRFHAVISRQGKEWYIADTYSKTGTAVNEVPVIPRASAKVADGDIVTFGNAVTVFSDPFGKTSDPRVFAPTSKRSDFQLTTAPATSLKKRVPVIVLNLSKRTIPLSGLRIKIGRNVDCDILLELPTVSRYHANIVRSENGWEVEDNASTAGTKVNGASVLTRQPLHNGDVIDVGGIEMTYYNDARNVRSQGNSNDVYSY